MILQSQKHDYQIQEAGSLASSSDPVMEGVEIRGNHLMFGLSDGHYVAIHLLFYPKLLDASELQRKNWQVTADGKGIRWADVGEDIWVTGLPALQRIGYLSETLDA